MKYSKFLNLSLFKKNMVIYTVIIGNYDQLNTPKVVDKNCDYICFTNNRDLTSDLWEIRVIETDPTIDATRNARKLKLLPHRYLSKYNESIYIDANYEIISSMRQWVNTYSSGKQIMLLKHPERDCIYDEARVVKSTLFRTVC